MSLVAHLLIQWVILQNLTSIIVTQFQIQDWPVDGQVIKPETIIKVLEDAIKVQHSAGGGPVVVHCRYVYIVKHKLLSNYNIVIQ